MSFDLLIIDDDICLDGYGEPELTRTPAGTVAQDIRHMIREKGYAIRLVADRNPATRRALLKKLELDIEEDLRIKPGTAKVTEESDSHIWCTAETEADEPVSVEVSL